MSNVKSPWKQVGIDIRRILHMPPEAQKHVYKRGNSYGVSLKVNGRLKWLGSRKTLSEAIELRNRHLTQNL